MNEPIIATRDRNYKTGWRVPVGSIVKDELRACDHCGHDINVLTVRTKDRLVVMEDDYHDRADEETTMCAECVVAMGPDE